MGTEIRRIEKEFVLSTVSDREMEVTLTGNKLESTGLIDQIDDDVLHMSTSDDLIESLTPGMQISVYFSYFGHVMTFTSTVRSSQSSILKIDAPELLYKNLSRKYSRIAAPSNSKVSFTIQETKVELNFPRSEEYDPVEPPESPDEFESGSIETLIERFRERTQRKASINRITMFRDRPPSGFEETIISQTGKVLFIPDTSGRFPENDFQMGGRIITRAMLLDPSYGIDDGDPIDGLQDRLPSLLAEKRDRGILAELYCPIQFHEYTIGYIYLAQDREMEGAFDHDVLEFADRFAKVLAYSLKTNGYFEGALPEGGDYEGEIIDVSAAGLLFCHASEKLSELLSLYTDIDLLLQFGSRKIRIGARLMRKYQSGELMHYGLQFMEIKPEDFRFLFEYVYGRAIRGEDESLWEGGSDPPALDF